MMTNSIPLSNVETYHTASGLKRFLGFGSYQTFRFNRRTSRSRGLPFYRLMQ